MIIDNKLYRKISKYQYASMMHSGELDNTSHRVIDEIPYLEIPNNSFNVIKVEIESVIEGIKTGLENEHYDQLGQIRTRINNLQKSAGSVANYPWDELLDMIHIYIPKPKKVSLKNEAEVIEDELTLLELGLRKETQVSASSSSKAWGW